MNFIEGPLTEHVKQLNQWLISTKTKRESNGLTTPPGDRETLQENYKIYPFDVFTLALRTTFVAFKATFNEWDISNRAIACMTSTDNAILARLENKCRFLKSSSR